jgi:hypothetical protein
MLLDRVRDGGDDDCANVGGLDTCLSDGLRACALGQINRTFRWSGPTTFDNAGALANPFIRGINGPSQVIVGDH